MKTHILYLITVFIGISYFLHIHQNNLEIQHEQNSTIVELNQEISVKDSIISEHTNKIMKLDSLYFSLLGNLVDLGQVDVTMYQPVEAQTNSRPWETADQSIINMDNPREHRWLAISRDLHARYGGDLQFGDLVWVTGIGQYNGLYEVRDLMNARFTRRIDILLGIDDQQFSFYQNPNIRMFKMPEDYHHLLADVKERHYQLSF